MTLEDDEVVTVAADSGEKIETGELENQ